MESRKRSAIKTICWHVIATSITMCVIYAFTGHFILAASIGAVDVVLNIIAYYFHERIWNLTDYGRENPTDP
jgi:uncharacterized membrane protein